MDLRRRQINFVLRHSRGPKQAHDFGISLRAQPRQNRSGVLAEITRSALRLPLLVKRAGIQFHLGADAALVVAQRFQIDAHPVVVISFAAQNDWRTA